MPKLPTMWVLIAAIVGSSMASIDGTAVNVALPLLQRDFGAGAAAIQWVIEGYSLFLSALILLSGALADRYGRRLIFVLGICLFAFASLLCGLAPSMGWLVAARCLQGVGGALATPGSLALIAANFSGEARGKAIGTWSGFSAVTSAIGPLLGGWLAQASWRWVFFINIPLAIIVVAISLWRVPESRDASDRANVDVGGAILATLGLGALTFGLIRVQSAHTDVLGIAAAIAGCALLVAFVAYERRVPGPMMPLDVFKNRTFSGANLYTLLLYAALGANFFFIPFNLQLVQGFTPVQAGAALLPIILILFVTSRWSGGLVARVGARTPLVAGALLAALAFVLYAFVGVGHPYWQVFLLPTIILGVGAGLFVAPLTTTVMDSIAGDRSGIASGINNAVSRVAALLAIAVLGIALIGGFYASVDRRVATAHLTAQTRAALERDRSRLSTLVVPRDTSEGDSGPVRTLLREAYASGFRDAMLVAAALAALAAMIALGTMPSRPRTVAAVTAPV